MRVIFRFFILFFVVTMLICNDEFITLRGVDYRLRARLSYFAEQAFDASAYVILITLFIRQVKTTNTEK